MFETDILDRHAIEPTNASTLRRPDWNDLVARLAAMRDLRFELNRRARIAFSRKDGRFTSFEQGNMMDGPDLGDCDPSARKALDELDAAQEVLNYRPDGKQQ